MNNPTERLRWRARQLRRWVGSWSATAADLLFPPRCMYCDHDLADLDHRPLLCERCREDFCDHGQVRCRRCGALSEREDPPEEGCEFCRFARLHFDAVVPLGGYHGDLRTAVLRMKHGPGEPLSAAMGDLLTLQGGSRLAELQADLVVPVPMHWLRRLKRGTNSPDILARRIALHMGAPVRLRLLARRRNTALQPDLSPHERFRNIQGVFRTGKGYDLGGARVLLVDDVLTTGATCSEAAKTLKQAGATYVAVAVVARAEGRHDGSGADA